MHQRRPIFFAMIMASLLLFSASTVSATWNIVLKTRGAHSGFFFNELVGFIGSTGSDGIFKTTNGGKTWISAKIPPGFTSGYITQIFMTDSLKGWATIEDFNTKQCIWKTTDGGLNWVSVGPLGQFDNIYETPAAVVVLSRDLNGNSISKISTDGGLTFFNGPMKLDNGIDFVDPTHGVITSFTDTAKGGWMITGDGGRSWSQINPVIRRESWSIYGVKGTPIFYTAAEGDPVAGRTATQIMKSVNYGASWTTVAPLSSNSTNFYSTGHIGGFGEMLYVQADKDPSINKAPLSLGMYRSMDKGLTWQFVQGPSHDRDTRFVVTGCSGGVVYAFDGNGNVWKTRDGGDGQIIEPPVEPIITGNPIVFSGKICETSKASIDIENLYCYEDTILSADLVDTTSDIIRSGALKITVMPSFPLVLLPNSKASINFDWAPFKLFHTDTTVTIQVKVRYLSKILQQTFDTVVTITVHAIGEPPVPDITPVTLNFDSVSFCAPHDTVFTILNKGCDTLYLLNAVGSSPVYYSILDSNGNPLALPVAIPPGMKEKIIIRINLTVSGTYSSDLFLSLKHQGIGKDTLVTIKAIISAEASYSVADPIDFGSVSTCVQIDSLIPIKNNSCVPLTITGAVLKTNTVFTLIGTPPYLPVISPNSFGYVHVRFSPNVQQSEQDILTLSLKALGEPLIKPITLLGIGYVSPSMLVTALPADTLFDLKLTRCDTSLPFRMTLLNPGCSSITVKSAVLEGIPTPNIILNLSKNLPFSISNGTSISISVLVTPKDIGTYNGNLHVTYQFAGDNTIHDTLIAYFLTVGYGSRLLAVDHDTIDLGTMKLCDTRDSAVQITNKGCDILDSINSTIQGQGNFSLTGTSFSFLGPNKQGNISFHFEPTQAGAVSGTLTITSVSDTLPIHIVTIKAFVIPTDTLIFSMLPTRGTFYAGDTLSVRLIPQRDVHGKGLRDAAFTMNFNSDLLTLLPDPVGIKVLMKNAQYIAGAPSGTPKHTAIRIFLQGTPTLEIDKDSPVMEFRFLVSLSDTITTRFDLTDVQLNGGASNFSKCELGLVSISLAYDLAFLCGDSTLVNLMQLKDKFTVFTDAVYPNPITGQNNYQGIIPFRTGGGGLIIGMDVFDQLGRTVVSKELPVEKAGSYHFTIDGRSLAAGCYTYILHEISASSSSVRGRFIISK